MGCIKEQRIPYQLINAPRSLDRNIRMVYTKKQVGKVATESKTGVRQGYPTFTPVFQITKKLYMIFLRNN